MLDANSPSNSLPSAAQSFSGENFFVLNFGPVLRLLEAMIFSGRLHIPWRFLI